MVQPRSRSNKVPKSTSAKVTSPPAKRRRVEAPDSEGKAEDGVEDDMEDAHGEPDSGKAFVK